MNKIKLDYNFCMSGNVNSSISFDDLQKNIDMAKSGYSKLMDMVSRGEVGFTKLPDKDLRKIADYAKSVSGQFNDMIVIGIGGSSLGLEAIENALLPFNYNTLSLAERGYFPRLWVADNVDSVKMGWILKKCNPEDTLVLIVTKSGSTVETAANACVVIEWLKEAGVDINRHVVAITDPESGSLRKYANKSGIQSFDIEKNVGGRFSVLSAVGLLPAAILGVKTEKLLEGAKTALENEKQFLTLSAIYLHYYIEKRINVLMPYSSSLQKFSFWFSQLWAESLGKKYDISGNEVFMGTTPFPAMGANDQHSLVQLFREGSDDKLITFVEVKSHSLEKSIKEPFCEDFNYLKRVELSSLLNTELAATEVALLKSKRPSLKIIVDYLDEFSLGYLFMLYELTTAIVGLSLNINPFDQPGVEEGKQFAYGILGRKGFEEKLMEFKKLNSKIDEYII